MKPKCDDVLKHTSVETTLETRFLRWDWELGKSEVSREVQKTEDAPCASDKGKYTHRWIVMRNNDGGKMFSANGYTQGDN